MTSAGPAGSIALDIGPTTSPVMSEPSHFLKLPPEIRNIIYIDYLELHPEIILHDHENSNDLVGGAPLLRVNQQIRAELTPMLKFCATYLVFRLQDDRMSQLIQTLQKIDRQTLSGMNIHRTRPFDAPSPKQLVAIQKSQTLRPRKSPTLAATLRQFPALRVLVLEVRVKANGNVSGWLHKVNQSDKPHALLRNLRLLIRPTRDSDANYSKRLAQPWITGLGRLVETRLDGRLALGQRSDDLGIRLDTLAQSFRILRMKDLAQAMIAEY